MLRAIVLDTGPLGIATKREGLPEADACRIWIEDWTSLGTAVYVPAIAYYEVRRELERIDHLTALARLDAFVAVKPNRYVVLTDQAIRRACSMWARARNKGTPIADPKELDCDVLIASQAIELGLDESEYIIATENVGHLSQFCPAASWRTIDPHST